MPDKFGADVRSRIMRAIKGKNTKPELRLAAALRGEGVRFRRGVKLPGRPDFVIAGRTWKHPDAFGVHPPRLAVFVHGCFWHCCPRHFKAPASGVGGGAEGWRRKFADNVRRDRRVRRRLNRLGWRTLVVWEHEDPLRAARRVRAAAGRRGRAAGPASRHEAAAQAVGH